MGSRATGGIPREAVVPPAPLSSEENNLDPIEEVTGEGEEDEGPQEGRRRRNKENDGLSTERVAEDAEEEGEEGREVRKGPIPYQPSKEEREQHELTHTHPFGRGANIA